MKLTVDPDLTRHYAAGWVIALVITPTVGAAHLGWNPGTLCDPETFVVRLGHHPLSRTAVRDLERAFASFDQLDVIAEAPWTYLHNQNRWGWAEGEWWDAVELLGDRLKNATSGIR